MVQVNEVLETLLQQLQAHNNPHAGAVQAAIKLAGTAMPGQRSVHASQVGHACTGHVCGVWAVVSTVCCCMRPV